MEGPGVKEVDKSTWEALEKSKNDEEAQEDLKGMMMKHNSQVYLLLMSKISAEVMLGHSPFQYISSKLGKDPYHRSIIIFVKDRTKRGDPMPYAVKKEEAKQWGKWKQVTAVSSNMERLLWFGDDRFLDFRFCLFNFLVRRDARRPHPTRHHPAVLTSLRRECET